MKNRLASLLLALVLLCGTAVPAGALGSDWLVYDSNTRRMTAAECWTWSYDALGFVYHEILARRGFVFDPDGQYGWYFMSQYWYHSISTRNNQDVYDALNSTEWYNIDLIKSVRDNMRLAGTTNPGGKAAPKKSSNSRGSYTEPTSRTLALWGFQKIHVNGSLRLAVYSAPGTSSWRGANGKALCNTNGDVYAAGRDGNWVLIAYYLNQGPNQGGFRVGYVKYSELTGLLETLPTLSFQYAPAVITAAATLTDDPLFLEQPITRLSRGTNVTLLMTCANEYGTMYAYIETAFSGRTVRGFVRLDAVSYSR